MLVAPTRSVYKVTRCQGRSDAASTELRVVLSYCVLVPVEGKDTCRSISIRTHGHSHREGSASKGLRMNHWWFDFLLLRAAHIRQELRWLLMCEEILWITSALCST